jgi:glycosyltransferase involved in cell wall biosynthesis
MKKVPRVSIVLPTHNGQRFLPQAIESVLGQDMKDFELLIVDDGSRASLEALVARYQDSRIRLIRLSGQLGLTKALNRGIAASRGTYIARIDDDDVWLSASKLTQQLTLMDADSRLALCGTQYVVVSEEGEELLRLQLAQTDTAIRAHMLRANQFGHSTVVVRREALDAVGWYDERVRFAQDYELWLRLGTRFQFVNLPGYSVAKRMRTRTISSAHHRAQLYAFLKSAYQYRKDYPGFYANLLDYGSEMALNALPYSWRRNLVALRGKASKEPMTLE